MNHQESLRITIQDRLKQGKSVEGILSQLLDRAPYTLLDLVFGPQAIQDERFLMALLSFLEDIEELLPLSRIPIDQFYHRLLSLAGTQEERLVGLLFERHCSKEWMIELIRRFQGGAYVLKHLLYWAEQEQDSILECVAQYIAQGFSSDVESYAIKKVDSASVILLLTTGHSEQAARALIKIIQKQNSSVIMEEAAAILGPQFPYFLEVCLGVTQRTSELKALDAYLKWYPYLQPALIKKIKKLERRKKSGTRKTVKKT